MKLTTGIVLQERTFEGKTYKVSPCKIEGYVDDQEALKQAIYKVLDTDQYEYPIYSFSYGIAWKELIGEEQPYVRAEMKRMIRKHCCVTTGYRRLMDSAFLLLGTRASALLMSSVFMEISK